MNTIFYRENRSKGGSVSLAHSSYVMLFKVERVVQMKIFALKFVRLFLVYINTNKKDQNKGAF